MRTTTIRKDTPHALFGAERGRERCGGREIYFV